MTPWAAIAVPTRRSLLQAAGAALVVSFTWPASSGAATVAASLRPPKPVDKERVESFLHIDADGGVTVYAGKVDLGTGVRTALAQLVAEELDVSFPRIEMIMGDTATTVDQWLTAGSLSISAGGLELRRAAATARRALLLAASRELGTPVADLQVDAGVVSVRGAPARQIGYGALVRQGPLELKVDNDVPLKTSRELRVVGKSVPRVDIPAKATGEFTFMQDFRLPGMLHARVVRPDEFGAKPLEVDDLAAREVNGFVRTVRNGDFIAVLARTEWGAIKAARLLRVRWSPGSGLPAQESIFNGWRKSPVAKEVLTQNEGDAPAVIRTAALKLSASYEFPVQTHASIGPSCAVAAVENGQLTVWTASQGPHSLREELAGIVKIPVSAIRVIYVDGSGCYGRNGHEDAAADAALLASIVRKPVRVQWMRADETSRAPKTPPRVIDLEAALARDGSVAAWNGEFTISTNAVIFNKAFDFPLLAATETGVHRSGNWVGSLHLNSAIPYKFPAVRVNTRQVAATPFRSAHLRSPGRMENTFANECFMDEIALSLKIDPAEFRLRHIDDPRGRAVLQAALARSGYQPHVGPARTKDGQWSTGRGVAYVRYNVNQTYVGVVVDVAVDPASGEIKVRRVCIAHDCGRIVNPDGVLNQIEGGVLQAVSRGLLEEVHWTTQEVKSVDWATYPILRAPDAPRVDVVLIDKPDEPSMGAGEAAGTLIPAALANALFDAAGVRVRSVPLTPQKVRAHLEAKAT